MNKARNSSLDVVRSIAILLVVLNHAVEEAFPLSDFNALASSGKVSLFFCFAVYTLGRIGVPLFLMLSGYLLLSRDYFKTKTGITDFYKKNLLPLLLTWEIWVLLYHVITAVSYGIPFSVPNYLAQAFFVKAVLPSHSWYVPVIIGFYLFVPFLAKILSLMRGRWIFLLLGVTYVFFFLLPFLNRLRFFRFTATLNLSFSGGVYGLYLILGYLLFRYRQRITDFFAARGRKLLFAAAAILLFFLTAFYHSYMAGNNVESKVWYDFFTIPAVSAAAFLLLSKIRPQGKAAAVFLEVSVCSFGIYLVHKLVQNALVRFIPKTNVWLEVLLYTVLAFLISFAVVTLIGRIGGGKVGKVLFLRKKPSKTI